MNDESELLRRYAEEREQAAFAEIVRRHIGLVYHAALRQTGDASLAEDVTQGVFTDLARKAGALAGRASITGWLYTSTRFAAAKARRGEQRRRAREQEVFAMHDATTGMTAMADWEQLRPVIDEALHALDERDREAVLLRFFEGRSLAEVGAKLAVSEDTARVRVARALDKLAGLLARRGITSTAAALGVAMAGQAGAAVPAGLAVSVAAGALAGVGLAGAAAVGGGVAIFMGTTKMTVAVVGSVVALGVGTAWWGANRAQEAREALAVATQEQVELSSKLKRLEVRVGAESERVQRAENENARLLAAADQVKEAVPAEAEPITSGMVTARMKRATALILENGDAAEALREFLWCYDVGMPQITGMSGVRSTAPVLLAKLGERYPPALEALRARRDAARERMFASERDRSAVTEFGAINRALKDDAANVALHDQLPPGDLRRRSLAFASYDYLVEGRRYKDAAEGKSYMVIIGTFDSFSQPRRVPAEETAPRAGETKVNADLVGRTARDIEMLAGAGELENARKLAQRLVAYDNSEATTALIQKHAERAGQPGLLGSSKNR